MSNNKFKSRKEQPQNKNQEVAVETKEKATATPSLWEKLIQLPDSPMLMTRQRWVDIILDTETVLVIPQEQWEDIQSKIIQNLEAGEENEGLEKAIDVIQKQMQAMEKMGNDKPHKEYLIATYKASLEALEEERQKDKVDMNEPVNLAGFCEGVKYQSLNAHDLAAAIMICHLGITDLKNQAGEKIPENTYYKYE
jgi:hypothetical protein